MILTVQMSSWDSAYKALTQEQWDELRVAIPMLAKEKPDSIYQDIVVDDDGLRAMSKYGLEIKLVESGENTMLVKLQNRIEALGIKHDDMGRMIERNAVVQIAIPDIGLLLIDEILVENNACTDHIQDLLDDRWRILAVCPPNAQRRPDYVMGRRKSA